MFSDLVSTKPDRKIMISDLTLVFLTLVGAAKILDFY